MPRASVIVRTKDSERTIERALTALRRQTVPAEIVVVDSGSTDASVEIARGEADRLIEITPEEYTHGKALNLGARAATAPTHFALSSHCVPPREDWIERSLAHYERSEVAGTGGYAPPGPGGRTGTVLQDMDLLRADPYWGYSNTAGSWRADLWERFPFDEHLEAAEDREWSWRVLAQGWSIAMDPTLEVVSEHRRSQGLKSLYERRRRETRAIAGFTSAEPYPVRQAVSDWWNVQAVGPRSPARIRASPWHLAYVLGRYAGERSARRC